MARVSVCYLLDLLYVPSAIYTDPLHINYNGKSNSWSARHICEISRLKPDALSPHLTAVGRLEANQPLNTIAINNLGFQLPLLVPRLSRCQQRQPLSPVEWISADYYSTFIFIELLDSAFLVLFIVFVRFTCLPLQPGRNLNHFRP